MQKKSRHFSGTREHRIDSSVAAPADSLTRSSKSGPKPRKLLAHVRDVLRVNHYSLRTEEAYLGWIRRFILFNGKKHPGEMGASEVETYLTHLAVDARVSTSSHRVTSRACSRSKEEKFVSAGRQNQHASRVCSPEKGDRGEESAGLTHIKQP